MTDEKIFDQLSQSRQEGGADALFETLLAALREQQDYHRLFDAKMLQKKHQFGLPLAQPTSLANVPEEKRKEFEQCYVDAARETGELFLAAGSIPQAWVYLRTIQEPDKVTEAIEALDVHRNNDDELEELLNVALTEGANPAKGIELMLHTHGTCNTITAMDQQIHAMDTDQRRRATTLLVENLHNDLTASVRYHVEQRIPMLPPGETLPALITGRDWLFEDGNYHIDTSHLHSVVRFARCLEPGDAALGKAIELADYGSHLDRSLQYDGEPPFENFFEASLHYLNAVSGKDVDSAVGYFKAKLDVEPDEEDKQMIAYVLVDMLIRCGKLEQAINFAEPHLSDMESPDGFSFSKLCEDAGRRDVLQRVSREQGNVIGFAQALVEANDG